MFQRNQPGAGPANANQPTITAPSRLRPAASPPASIDEAIAPVENAAAAPETEPAANLVFTIRVELSGRYNTHKGEMSVILVREPTMADWMKIG
jgi:hypothetical protein